MDQGPGRRGIVLAGLRSRLADAGLGSRFAAVVATDVTDPPAPRSPRLRRGRLDLVFAADVVIAVICFGVTDSVLETRAALHHHAPGTQTLLLVSFLLCAPLVLRTALPLTSWTASALVIFWSRWIVPPASFGEGGYIPAGVIVYVLCLYAVAVRCKPRVVAGAGVVTVAGAAFISPPTAVTAVFVAAAPVLAGVIVRSRRGSQARLEVAERRHEGERALFEERQRIARELHDVVAHHMSVIAIQAEAAPYKTADPPAELVESFGEIRASALSGLNELRRVLGVLRSDRPDTAPQPGLDDLAGLFESARSAGLTVTAEVSGAPRPVPEGVGLSAYRIVQEALSNAMRHAPGATVQVKVYYGGAALVIEVRNDGHAAGRRANGGLPGGGHGIVGMRERAAMLGGHVTTGRTDKGEFLVTAALPLDGRRPEDPP